MSIEESISEMIEAYDKAKNVHQDLQQQQQTIISKLRSIANDIQELERSIKKGKYSVLVSWSHDSCRFTCAPFTIGGSLSLTAAGTAIGLCSGAADFVQT